MFRIQSFKIFIYLFKCIIVVHGLSSAAKYGILVPQPGIESMFPALTGGFLTSRPPGKFLQLYLTSRQYEETGKCEP